MSTSLTAKTRPPRHDEQEIELGLTVLALSAGNCGRAARRLKQEHGVAIHRVTLSRWRDAYASRYEEVRLERAPQIQERIAAATEEVALRGAELTMATLHEYEQHIGELTPRELSSAARDMSVITGVAVDKTLHSRERPIVARTRETRDIGEIIRSLESLGVLHEIEPPVLDAEVIDVSSTA